MELRFQQGLQVSPNNLLRNAVSDCGYTQRPRSTIRFRDVHPAHRWRQVTTRRQPVPELIEVTGKPGLEFLDRLPIYSSRSLVGFHTLESFPDFPLRNVKRLCPVQAAPPITGWPPARTETPQPLRSSTITVPSSLLRAVLPLCSASVLKAWRGSPARPAPFTSERQVPTFRIRA